MPKSRKHVVLEDRLIKKIEELAEASRRNFSAELEHILERVLFPVEKQKAT